MKLARYLLRATGDARYGDGLERVVYNALLAVKQPDSDGGYPYYSTYGVHAVKEYYPHKWPCCSGTLIQGVADYVLNVYFQTANAVYVNLFVPSEVTWTPRRRVREASFRRRVIPRARSLAISVQTAGPATFSLGLRVPGWLAAPHLGAAAEIRVNGVKQHACMGDPAYSEAPHPNLEERGSGRDASSAGFPHRGDRCVASEDGRAVARAGSLCGVGPTGLDATGSGLHGSGVPPERAPREQAPIGLCRGGGGSGRNLQRLAPGRLRAGRRDRRHSMCRASNEQRTVFVPFYRVQNESYNLYLQQT